MDTYDEHTLSTFLSYRYGDWSRSPRLLGILEARAARVNAGDSGEAARARSHLALVKSYQRGSVQHFGRKVRVTINTDDGALFGIHLIDEYYRVALALDLTPETLAELARESIASAIQPLDPAEVSALRERVGSGGAMLELPGKLVGGLNEFVVDQLATVAEAVALPAGGPAILREGAAEDGNFYLVVAGTAQVTLDGHVVATLGKNELFGEMASISGKRTATVSPGKDGVKVLRIRKEEFVALCGRNVTVRTYFENLIASRDSAGEFRSFASHFSPATT
ncbi:MAG: cyclic nucleotide-binding domain-containing protein [Candidatus Sericytochromatia bacterium]|nr:cyclic nucleotide-binding domain-containing protein [Candidatus Tanganyikabacteria bacterium]